jgi:monothiol glutaredoxin
MERNRHTVLARPKTLSHSLSPIMTIYIKSHCPWCKEALAWLDQHGYRYEVREVLEDPGAMARMREISGQSLTPTMEVDGKVLADFDTGQLSEFLEANDIRP